MKSLLLFFVLLAGVCLAQTPPKPPVGVPADAKFFQGKWYRVYLEKGLTWHRAKAKCQQLGGQLLTVSDASTWTFAQTLTKGPILWIGATDEETTGLWKWIDGSPLSFTAWEPGQPDNAKGIQHYAVMNKAGKWDDLQKEVKSGPFEVMGFICEWKK